MRTQLIFASCLMVGTAFAQQRDAFLLQQTQQEMQRVSGQVDVLQNNMEDLQRRLNRIEGAGDGTKGVRAEIEALKAGMNELRREISAMRGEIVRDLSGRIAKMQQPAPPPPAPTTVKKTVISGPHLEYVVQNGDTLSFISETFKVPVSRIKELNNLKGNNLRVGQKLVLPKGK